MCITHHNELPNRLTEIDDSANGIITRSYDNFDRLTEETTAQGTVDYTYDADGRRATMTVTGQTEVDYAYGLDDGFDLSFVHGSNGAISGQSQPVSWVRLRVHGRWHRRRVVHCDLGLSEKPQIGQTAALRNQCRPEGWLRALTARQNSLYPHLQQRQPAHNAKNEGRPRATPASGNQTRARSPVGPTFSHAGAQHRIPPMTISAPKNNVNVLLIGKSTMWLSPAGKHQWTDPDGRQPEQRHEDAEGGFEQHQRTSNGLRRIITQLGAR